MSQNTRTQNSGHDADPRRNNLPQYNPHHLCPQVEEQESDEPPPIVERSVARRQPHFETRTERLEQRIDKLTELVNMLIAALGQNATNVAPIIPPANAEGEKAPPY